MFAFKAQSLAQNGVGRFFLGAFIKNVEYVERNFSTNHNILRYSDFFTIVYHFFVNKF